MTEASGAALTGILVVLAFPIYGYTLGLDSLILVALVPLLLAGTGGGVRRGLLLGWGAGMIIEGAGFLWLLFAIRSFTDSGAFLAALGFGIWLAYASLLWVLLGGALGLCRRPGQVLIVIFFWIALESYFPRLFTWNLGGALYQRRTIVQCVDVVGASGLTALVFLANAVVYFLVLSFRRRARFPLASLIVLGVLGLAVFWYGKGRLAQLEALQDGAPRHTVLMMQGFLRPELPDESDPSRSLDYYTAATREALARLPAETVPDVRLLLWPEGADDLGFGVDVDRDPWLSFVGFGHPAEKRQALESLLREGSDASGSRVLMTGGWGVRTDVEGRTSNLAVYLRPGEAPAFYEKNVLMPLGEWIPFLELVPLSWRHSMGIYVSNRIAGKGNAALRFRENSFRFLICYEAVLPGYVRRSAEGVDFLVNLTEDIWYGRTAHIPQHVSMLILRAIENRTPILRCTNVGPSGVVDITGAFDTGVEVFAPEAVLKTFRAVSVPTLYQTAGHWLPFVAVWITCAGVVVVRRRARKLQGST